MGQKTNPNILRLGKIKEWESKYIEKKPTESSVIIFRDLEIKKFILRLFDQNKLKVQNCKTYYSEDSLHIYISYYNTTKSTLLNNKIKIQSTKRKSKIFKTKFAILKKLTLRKRLYLTKTYQKIFKKHLKRKYFKNPYSSIKKTQRLKAINNFQDYIDGNNFKTCNTLNKHLFLSKVLKGLNLFTNKKHNIFLNLKQINKEAILFQKISKETKHEVGKNLTKLRKFQRNEFFKKGFNLLYHFVTNKQNSTFLAEFIALFLEKLKRPNFFLRFLKLALSTLTTKKFSQFQRIQIKIKGRFNGAPRSTHKFINIGKNIPVLTLNSKIDYGEAIAYTSNGTFGVKIWTYTTNTKIYHVQRAEKIKI